MTLAGQNNDCSNAERPNRLSLGKDSTWFIKKRKVFNLYLRSKLSYSPDRLGGVKAEIVVPGQQPAFL